MLPLTEYFFSEEALVKFLTVIILRTKQSVKP